MFWKLNMHTSSQVNEFWTIKHVLYSNQLDGTEKNCLFVCDRNSINPRFFWDTLYLNRQFPNLILSCLVLIWIYTSLSWLGVQVFCLHWPACCKQWPLCFELTILFLCLHGSVLYKVHIKSFNLSDVSCSLTNKQWVMVNYVTVLHYSVAREADQLFLPW